MSVVVALRSQDLDSTFIATDSAADAGDQRFLIHNKIWQPNPWFALGFVGDLAAGVRVQYELRKHLDSLPAPKINEASWCWEHLCPVMAEAAEISEESCGLTILAAIRSKIIIVEFANDRATPWEDSRGYAAIGTGAGYSLGYLEAVKENFDDLDSNLANAYVVESVKAAITHCPSVAAPVFLHKVSHEQPQDSGTGISGRRAFRVCSESSEGDR